MKEKDEITQDEVLRGMRGLGGEAPPAKRSLADMLALALFASLKKVWPAERDVRASCTVLPPLTWPDIIALDASTERAAAVKRAAEVEAAGIAKRDAEKTKQRADRVGYLVDSIQEHAKDVRALKVAGAALAKRAGSLRKYVDEILRDGQALGREKEDDLRAASALLDESSDESMLVTLGGPTVMALRAELAEHRARQARTETVNRVALEDGWDTRTVGASMPGGGRS